MLIVSKPEINEFGLSKFVPARVVKKGVNQRFQVRRQDLQTQILQNGRFHISFLPNKKQKRLRLSKAMEVAVKPCFRNYQFEGKNYGQSEGGPIGLRLSMAVSRI